MKIQKVSKWFSLLLFITVAAGCAQSTESVATSSPVASVSPVSSASPTETMLLTLTPAATGTSTPSSTPTAIPTLSAEDARKRLLDLLATSGDCRLPCLWGIAPGKSSNQEARNILMPLSSISAPETTYFDPARLRGVLLGTISPIYVEGDQQLNSRVAYLYSVMIASSGPSINRSGSIFTHIAVLYPNQGIWAQYTTLINENEVGSSIISCPVNAHIEMNLSPPGNPNSFYSLLEETEWGVTKNGYRPLEEATSMSMEEFYQTFRNPNDKCIETSVNLWPTPER